MADFFFTGTTTGTWEMEQIRVTRARQLLLEETDAAERLKAERLAAAEVQRRAAERLAVAEQQLAAAAQQRSDKAALSALQNSDARGDSDRIAAREDSIRVAAAAEVAANVEHQRQRENVLAYTGASYVDVQRAMREIENIRKRVIRSGEPIINDSVPQSQPVIAYANVDEQEYFERLMYGGAPGD